MIFSPANLLHAVEIAYDAAPTPVADRDVRDVRDGADVKVPADHFNAF